MSDRTEELGLELKTLIQKSFFNEEGGSQKDAARLLAIGESTLSEYIKGKKRDPHLYELMKSRVLEIAKLRTSIKELEETKEHLLKDQKRKQESIDQHDSKLRELQEIAAQTSRQQNVRKRFLAITLSTLFVVALVSGLYFVYPRSKPVTDVNRNGLSELVDFSKSWKQFSKEPASLMIASDFLTYGALQSPKEFLQLWKNLISLADSNEIEIEILLPEPKVRKRALAKFLNKLEADEYNSWDIKEYFSLIVDLKLAPSMDALAQKYKSRADIIDLYLSIERKLIEKLRSRNNVAIKESCQDLHSYNMWMVSTDDNKRASLKLNIVFDENEIELPKVDITDDITVVNLRKMYNSLQECDLIQDQFYQTASRVFSNSFQNPFGKCDTTNNICRVLEGHYALKKSQAGEAYKLTISTNSMGEYEYNAEEADLFLRYSKGNALEGLEILRNSIIKDQKIVATVFSTMYEKWQFTRNERDDGWEVNRSSEDTEIWFRVPELIDQSHFEGVKEVMNSLSGITADCQEPASILDRTISEGAVELVFRECILPSNITSSGDDTYVKGFVLQ